MLNVVVITAGGTGGHLYPAQALAQQLLKQSPPFEILFAAAGLAKNRYFDRNRFLFKKSRVCLFYLLTYGSFLRELCIFLGALRKVLKFLKVLDRIL